MSHSPPETIERIEAAMAAVAYAIEEYPGGEVYWPIFERLERERENMISRAERLKKARSRHIQAGYDGARAIQAPAS